MKKDIETIKEELSEEFNIVHYTEGDIYLSLQLKNLKRDLIYSYEIIFLNKVLRGTSFVYFIFYDYIEKEFNIYVRRK